MARRSAMTTSLGAGSAPEWSPALIAALVEFSLVALFVAVLIRFARAPRALALYLVLGAIVSVVVSAVGLPVGYLGMKALAATVPLEAGRSSMQGWWISSAKVALEELARGLGALAGAWIVATVSLARIRDAGFSGDDPDGRGLRAKPEAMGWGFVGWEGRAAGGEALVALAFVAVELLAGLAGIVVRAAYLLVPSSFEGEAVARGVQLGLTVGLALAWLLAAWMVTRRSGVASLWLLPAAGMLQTLWFALRGGLFDLQGPLDPAILLTSAMNVLSPIAILVATLAGTELALRARPATLADAPDPQDSDAVQAPGGTQEADDG